MWMTLEELRAMTRATHARKVCKVLTAMGVPWKVDSDGNPVVLRSAVERVLGVKHEPALAPPIDVAERLRLAGFLAKKRQRR